MRKFTLLTLSALVSLSAAAVDTSAMKLAGTKVSNLHVTKELSADFKASLGKPAVRKAASRAEWQAPIYIEDLPETVELTLLEGVSEGFDYFFGELEYKVSSNIDQVGADFTNGTLYLPNPVTPFLTNTYIKVTSDAPVVDPWSKATYSTTLPQVISTDFDMSTMTETPIYVAVMEVDMDKGTYVMAPAEKQHISYEFDGEKKEITMILEGSDEKVEGYPRYILGVCAGVEDEATGTVEYLWAGYGDNTHKYIDFDRTITYLPQGLELQDWFISGGDRTNYRMIRGAVDEANGKIYLADLSTTLMKDPGDMGVAVGDIVGDKVVFKSRQCLGYTDYDYYMFFITSTYKVVHNLWYYTFIDELEFNYDKETQTLVACEEETSIVINSTTQSLLPENWFSKYPIIRRELPADRNAQPEAPVFVEFYNDIEECGTDFNGIVFEAKPFNVNGYLLDDVENLYYNAYIDGQLFTFTPEQYVGITEAVTDVPYEFYDDNYQLFFYNGDAMFAVYDNSVRTIGLQLNYKGADGVLYRSEITTYDRESGIRTIDADARPLAEEYFTLTGAAVRHPEAGLYIRATTFDNGSRRIEKIILR
ncbi:MAG: hypothetical protein HUK14_02520 [Muribaculaceae bacterium]|nr:hypothetical protein [Muribaculaceae bacterium]